MAEGKSLTRANLDTLIQWYLSNLTSVAEAVGLPASLVFTHLGGTGVASNDQPPEVCCPTLHDSNSRLVFESSYGRSTILSYTQYRLLHDPPPQKKTKKKTPRWPFRRALWAIHRWASAFIPAPLRTKRRWQPHLWRITRYSGRLWNGVWGDSGPPRG